MARWQARAAGCGLVAVALTLVALLLNGGVIVSDLRARTGAALSTEAMSWASLDLDGRDVILSGSAPSEELRRLATTRVERLFGVRSVDDAAVVLLPETIPYTVTLSRAGNVLTIAGSAPSAPERRRMVEAFARAVPNAAYNDRLVLARGAPERGLPEALAALYPLLADVSRATVTLTDQEIAIEGEAATNAAYARLALAPTALPPGFRVTRRAIARPAAAPFVFSAELAPSSLQLTGYAPSPDARNALFGAARAVAGSRSVRDAVDLASGAPPGFEAVAAEAVDFLGLMASGRLAISDGQVSIEGVAANPDAYRTLTAYLDTWRPQGFTVKTSVGLPVVSPYTLTVVRNGDSVTVSGFVPDRDVQTAVRETATRVAGLKGAVVETTLADGAPAGYTDAARFAVDLMQYLSAGSATIADQRLVISGAARTGAHLLDLSADVASAPPPGFTVDVRVTPPEVDPYLWSMEKGDDGIVLTGYVPSEQARTRVRELAEDTAGDLGVADRTQLAGGLPSGIDLEAVAAFAAKELAELEAGTVSLSEDTLSLSGRTGDARAAVRVIARFNEALPAGTQKGTLTIDAPPLLQFRIERGLDALSIEGTVSDPAARDRIADQIARSFGRADVEMALDEAPDLPEGATDAVLLAVRAASLLATGTVTVSGPVITVQGKAFTGVGATRLSSDIAAAVPKGFRLDTSVGVARRGPDVSAEECTTLLSDLQARNTLYFLEGAPTLAAESHGLLDRLAQTLLRCRNEFVLIEGVAPGADSEALWKGRADAVAVLLESTGLDPARMRTTATVSGDGGDGRIAVRINEPAPPPVTPEPPAPSATPEPPAPAAPSVPEPSDPSVPQQP